MLCYNIKPFTCNIASGRHIFIALLNLITLCLFAFAPFDPGWILHPVLIHHSFLFCLSLDRSFFFWGACRPNSVSLMFICRATWPPSVFLIMHDLHQPGFDSDPYTVFLYTPTSLGPLITGFCFQLTPELRRAKPDEIEPNESISTRGLRPLYDITPKQSTTPRCKLLGVDFNKERNPEYPRKSFESYRGQAVSRFSAKRIFRHHYEKPNKSSV